MKKKGFWRFFVKRFIIALIIWAVIVGIDGAACYGYVLTAQMTAVNDYFDMSLHQIESLEENDINLFKTCLYTANREERMDIAYAIVNEDTKETYYSDGIFVYYYPKQKVSENSYKTGHYYFDCEELREYITKDYNQYFETYKKYKELNIYMDIYFDDVYFKGESFVSNKADVIYHIYNDYDADVEPFIEETKSYDLKLPDNLNEYTLDNKFKEGTTGQAFFLGSEPNSKALERIKESEISLDNTEFHLNDVRVDRSMEFEHLGTNYSIYLTSDFEVLPLFANDLIFPSVWFFLFLLMFVVLFSYIAFYRYRKNYEMYLYRVEMTNTLAHDLKSPLTAISGYAENLCSNVHTEKKDYYANAILDNTKYMNDIIDNVLELSKVEVGKIKLEKSEFDIIELAESLCAKYKLQLDDKKIKLNLSGNAVINADKNKITQAVENLISNAVKYTDEGGEITVTANSKSFKVSNTCKDAEKLNFKEIVKPFIKGDNSRSGRKGTGLGFSIVKNIVELSGYKFKVYNDNGKFTVEIVFKF